MVKIYKFVFSRIFHVFSAAAVFILAGGSPAPLMAEENAAARAGDLMAEAQTFSGAESTLSAVQAGDFRIKLTQLDEIRFSVQIFYKNEAIEPIDTYREVNLNLSSSAFPDAGLNTVEIEMFTGGANCCTGYYLLVQGEDGTACAGYVEPYDGFLYETGELNGYAALDPAFRGYERGELFLSRAETDGLVRLLIFDDGRWRTDAVGEFPTFYKMLFERELRGEHDASHPAFRAIALAYYSVMQGKSGEQVRRILKENMPHPFNDSAMTEAVYEDILKSIEAFSPVENIIAVRPGRSD